MENIGRALDPADESSLQKALGEFDPAAFEKDIHELGTATTNLWVFLRSFEKDFGRNFLVQSGLILFPSSLFRNHIVSSNISQFSKTKFVLRWIRKVCNLNHKEKKQKFSEVGENYGPPAHVPESRPRDKKEAVAG
ncbi:hypothetical protein PV11_05544 [Exophiala sideris]|uniref:Uncharacterized protein n=1 Tax=Exophiala sideris TaxID=1016849 RepID=A0A0D1YQE8_9EURO|nr:hypothetical protein PV11_05544 [Exophiala sideris]